MSPEQTKYNYFHPIVGALLTHSPIPGRHSSTMNLPTSALLIVHTVAPSPTTHFSAPLTCSPGAPVPIIAAGLTIITSLKKFSDTVLWSIEARRGGMEEDGGVGIEEDARRIRYSNPALS
jgi:hypothetical protein